MGIKLTTILNKLLPKKRQYRILLIGLDGSGKTTILYKLKFYECYKSIRIIPTIGFNVETILYKNILLTIWDVGGQDKLRTLWRHYYHNTNGIIFVIDSKDLNRLNDASKELKLLLDNYELKDSILLIYANKQDLPGAMSTAHIANFMKLNDIKDRKWYIQGTCALQNIGLIEGLDWLSNELST